MQSPLISFVRVSSPDVLAIEPSQALRPRDAADPRAEQEGQSEESQHSVFPMLSGVVPQHEIVVQRGEALCNILVRVIVARRTKHMIGRNLECACHT